MTGIYKTTNQGIIMTHYQKSNVVGISKSLISNMELRK